MEMHALKHSDYHFVEWSGRARVVAAPAVKPELPALDTTRISLATDRELRYWTDELGVTIYEIRDAIAATGSRCATAVRNYLGRIVTRSAVDVTV